MQRVAVIGTGTMGRVHIEAYARIPEAELVAICDTRLEAAEELAKAHSAEAFADLKSLLAEVEVDVVDICTPTSTHLDYIKQASEAGKHVCCEKPLCRTTGQALEALRLCEDAGVTLFVAHVLRWFPEFKRLHDLAVDGAIGNVVAVRTSRSTGYPRGTDDWFGNMKQSGGVVLDVLIHDFDWLRWCFGKVRRVYARGLYECGLPEVDHALVTLRFESGVIAHVEGTWMKPTGFETSVEIAGTGGLLNYSSKDAAPITIATKAKPGEAPPVPVPESPTLVSPYYLELKHLMECLESGAKPDVTGEDGVEAVRVAEAALRSISTGRPVSLA